MREFVTLAVLMIGWAFPAHSQDWESCVGIENDIARLQCFDAQSKTLSASPPTSIEQHGDESNPHALWEKREERDPISDRRNVSYFASPTEPQFNKFGMNKTVFLQLRCFDNTTAVVLYFDDYQIGEKVRVTIRMGDGQPREERWSLASNHQAAGKWQGSSAIPFIKSMVGNDTIAIRAQLNDGQDTYIFNVSRVEEYATDIAEACNWSLK